MSFLQEFGCQLESQEGVEEDEWVGLKDEKAFQREEYARRKKFERFLLSPALSEKITATLLSLQPGLRTLGWFFETVSSKSTKGEIEATTCLALTQPSRSPAVEAVRELLKYLTESDHSHWWALLPSSRQWTGSLLVMAATMTWIQIGQIFSRLVLPFARWPWKAGQLLENRMPSQKKRLAQEFLTLCEHREPFLQRMREGLNSVEEVLSEDNLSRWRNLLLSAPVTNMVSEMAFARSHTRRASNHGNDATPPTLAAHHVLCESKSLLNQHMATCSAVSPGPAVVAASPSPADSQALKGCSGWHAFVAQHPGRDLKVIAAKWAQVSVEEKAQWKEEARKRKEAVRDGTRPVAASHACSHHQAQNLWPYTADADYPIRATLLEPLSCSIRQMSDAWDARVGAEPCQGQGEPRSQEGAHCKESWCTSSEKNEVFRKRLNRWSAMHKIKAPSIMDIWRPLPLYFIGSEDPASSASSGESAFGMFLLELCGLHDSQVYATSSSGIKPEIDVVVNIKAELTGLVSAGEVLQKWLAAGEHMPTKAWHVEYEQVSLTRLRVTGLADLDVKEQESALARRREKCHVRAVLQGLDDETLAKPPRKRVRTKAPDCARALASKAHAEEATMEDMLEWDEELEAEAEPEAGSSEALVQLEVNQSITIPVAEAEDMRSARAAEDAIAAGPSAASQEAEAGDERQNEAVLTMDKTGRVHANGQCLGRVTQLRKDTPQESFSAYCSLHGCQIMRRMQWCPDQAALLEWYRQGLALPVGRDVALQARHKASFPKRHE